MFRGPMVALITPFTDTGIDKPALIRIVTRCLEAGIEAFIPCGTTGEAAVLSDHEYGEVLTTVLETTQGRVPVIAGCGTNSTATTISRGLLAKKEGVDGLLVVTPYYNKPNQDSLVRHYNEVATQVDLPVIVYNVPSRTGVDLLPQTVVQLAIHPRIVGIKEATGSLRRACDLIYALPEHFTVLSGDDFTALPFILSGGHGVISVVANVTPHHVSAMVKHAREAKIEQATALNKLLFPLIEALFSDTNPVPVKMALKLLGYGNGLPRLPLLPLKSELTAALGLLLQNMHIQ